MLITSRRRGHRPGHDLIPRSIVLVLLVTVITIAWDRSSGENASDAAGTVRGIVVNSITREPISRALVSSPDSRFATLTNSEGRFEFALARVDQGGSDGRGSSGPVAAPQFDRPYMLTARKPGFITDPYNQVQTFEENGGQDITLTLVPEGMIAGTVTLPSFESPDSIGLQLYKRQVQNGRLHWVSAGNVQTTSDGHFRFAELQAGTYKLLTLELLDSDPLTREIVNHNPFVPNTPIPLFGYPPVYYQNASDFSSGDPIHLTAGQTLTLNLSLVKQSYYRVRVPVVFPDEGAPNNSLAVTVYAHGHNGPGFSLGYDNAHHVIQGLLPNGNYTIEATSFGMNGVSGTSGVQTISVKSGPVEGPALILAPNGSIPIQVKEEFTAADNGRQTQFMVNGRPIVVKEGPRRYLNVNLESADDFAIGRNASLPAPRSPGDRSLFIDGVSAGIYWVRVVSFRGYAASVRSGSLDLLREPLVVGAGGAVSPIEITMRDDSSEIRGTVAGMAKSTAGTAGVLIYCVPLEGGSREPYRVPVQPNGSFIAADLVPGGYRLMAFDREQMELANLDPEAMQAYESKGTLVRLMPGQKEQVALQLISTAH